MNVFTLQDKVLPKCVTYRPLKLTWIVKSKNESG